jgi:hypothetical protein
MKINEVQIIKEPVDSKSKYRAIFIYDDNKKKTTKFGAKGYADYTVHKDIARKQRYVARHKTDLETGDPTRAGYLSMYILWNKPSFTASVEDYKRRINIFNQTGIFPVN